MGYDLTNARGEYHQWKVLGWWHLLNLATNQGWKPLGTLPPPGHTAENWDGNYYGNDGQTVKTEDAASLADAVERLLADRDREKVAQDVAHLMQKTLDDETIASSSDARDVLKYPLAFVRGMQEKFGRQPIGVWKFDEKSDEYLRKFIAFCRGSTFTIT